jgi:hypothetical protein
MDIECYTEDTGDKGIHGRTALIVKIDIADIRCDGVVDSTGP